MGVLVFVDLYLGGRPYSARSYNQLRIDIQVFILGLDPHNGVAVILFKKPAILNPDIDPTGYQACMGYIDRVETPCLSAVIHCLLNPCLLLNAGVEHDETGLCFLVVILVSDGSLIFSVYPTAGGDEEECC